MKRTAMQFCLLLALATSSQAQDTTQKQFVGTYKFPEGSVVPEVEVLIENGVLMMNSTAGPSPLELIKSDSFNITNFNGTAVFKRNDLKKVIGVHIEAGGYVLDGTRDSASLGHHAFKTIIPTVKEAVLVAKRTVRIAGHARPDIIAQQRRLKSLGAWLIKIG